MGWLSWTGPVGAIVDKMGRDKKKRDASRRAEQAADPMGREQNDKRMYDATMQSKDQEGAWSGRLDTSRAATDAAGSRLANGGASRSDRLAGGNAAVPGASGGVPWSGVDSRGGMPGYTTPNGGVTAVGGGTPAWQSSFAPGGGPGGGMTPAQRAKAAGEPDWAKFEGGPEYQGSPSGPTPGGMTRGWNPTNVQGLSFDAISRSTPGATDAYSTDSLDNYDSENLRGVDAGATIDRYTGGPNRFAQAMGGANLAAWDDGGVGAFDAGAALKEYATGAWNDTKMDLGNLLGEQEAASQRGGRLNSGFFDRDKGRVITDSTNRFTNALAQQAVQAAGITGDMKARAAQMRLSQAGDRDRLALDGLGLGLEAGQSVTDAELERASGMDRNRLDAIRSGRELALDKSQFTDDYRYRGTKDAADLNLDRAKSLDEMGLDKSKYVDSWDQDNAQFGDTMDYNRQRDAANLAEGREGRDLETWMALGDRYRNELTGMDDRITGRRNAKAQAKQNRFQNLISIGGLGIKAASAAAGG